MEFAWNESGSALKSYRSLEAIDGAGTEARQGEIFSGGVLAKTLTRLGYYFQLTKPTIMLLVLVTGGTALVLEGSLLSSPFRAFLFMAGLYLAGGSANAFNQYFERDIDALMSRTKKRRPLPMNKVHPGEALTVAMISGAAGVILLGVIFNLVTAALALGTILFYSLYYTLWLKPHTPQNIVIGGLAGAMAPIGAWTATTGTVTAAPVILFLIVFFWTPPHFWSLALCFKDDYRKSGLPMLPVVHGTDSALKHILIYSVILILTSLSYFFFGGGWIYLIAALALGGYLMARVRRAWRVREHKAYWAVFGASIGYLFGLFLAMILDKFVSGWIETIG